MLSFVIPTLNEKEHLGRLLEGIRSQMGPNDEIVVVDSQSNDGTPELAKEHGATVLSTAREGCGIARTKGARIAKNEVVVFLDADTVLPDSFAERIRTHFSNPETIAVGGIDYYEAESKAKERVYNAYSELIYFLTKLTKITTGLTWVPSNNSAFRRQIFLDAGGYRSVILEDTDLMKRLPKNGRIIQDKKLAITISDRRFKEHGFLSTVALWGKSNFSILFGAGGLDSTNLKEGY